MNNVVLVGRLGKDVEVRYTQDNLCVASGSLAVAGYSKDKTEWIYFSAFSHTAEFLEKYGRKGTSLAIVGHLHNEQYTKDDKNYSRLQLIVDRVEFAGSKNSGSTENGTVEDGFVAADDEEELPFQ